MDAFYSDKPGGAAVDDPQGAGLNWAPGLGWSTPAKGTLDAWYLDGFCKPA
jgi:hypothetical protein